VPPSTKTDPWWKEGLPFSCTRCGKCCRIEGYVWVDDEEIERIAVHLGLEPDVLAERFVRRVGKRFSLKEKKNHDCIFWDEGCTIYDARPDQCRTFPFWRQNLESPDSWQEVVEECPGSGTGRVYSRSEIESLLSGNGETRDEGGDDR